MRKVVSKKEINVKDTMEVNRIKSGREIQMEEEETREEQGGTESR